MKERKGKMFKDWKKKKNTKRGEKICAHVQQISEEWIQSRIFLCVFSSFFLKKNHPESERQERNTSLRSSSSIVSAAVSDSQPVFRPTCLIYLNI